MTDVLTVNPFAPEPDLIARAAECLRRGGLVAFPTETVYGLGVSALDAAAVQRLFEAKGRPADDPLIVHVAALADIDALVRHRPGTLSALAARFWPGPLTVVLPRSSAVPDAVTAGLDTVAIRVPAHPVARALIEAAGIPVAAPSANLFSRPSPTRAAHVLEDLDGRIDLLIDAGATTVGLESTVLDLSQELPTVLRPGAVTIEMLRPLLPNVRLRPASAEGEQGPQRSPGLLSKHYAPRAPLTLYEGRTAHMLARMEVDAARERAAGRRVGVLLADDDAAAFAGDHVVRLGPSADMRVVAARLYAALREMDAAEVAVILARGFNAPGGLADAVTDRLRRASAGRVVLCEP